MKKFIKSLLGGFLINKIRENKNKVFPGKTYLHDKLLIEKSISFYSNFIKTGDLCFDVGANVGNKVQPLLALKAKIVAIEPQESCHRILKMKFGNQITLIPYGLGEREEIKDFYISDSSTISSFSNDWIDKVKKDRFKNNNWNVIQKIPVTTIDKLIEEYGIPVFIKIDVEGFELEVLKGLSVPIKMISFEYTVPEQTSQAIACIKRLYSINPEIKCNYSVSDSMIYSLERWLNADEMIRFISSDIFIESGFGDIYVKS